VAGQYKFQVRAGQVVITPSIPDPEPCALMLPGWGIVGFAARRRRHA
jgi:hypothetical protein